MFVLAPSLVASPNETLTSTNEANISLPASFVEETLRVAVYVEHNTTLPAYATGGIYTNYSGNVISFLQGEGYAVTSVTTQDILDHKLLAANYDAFVLPNQLPKDDIVDLVKDYWLAGGGILSFEGSIGYCFYAGMIDESLEGGFELTPPASPGYWAYADAVAAITVMERHPVTQAYEVDIEFLISAVNTTIINGVNLPAIVGSKMTNLIGWNESTYIPIVATFEDPDKGGKIVQIPGNCSFIPVWERPIITDAIDWLAPKPKARVAFDFSHIPYYGVDDWDTSVSFAPRYNYWRDFLVNHSFTADKLYPTGSNLTAADIAPYDVLIVATPSLNYSLSEISLYRNWVSEGNGLFYIGDWQTINYEGQTRFNELMDPWGLGIDLDGTNAGTFTTTDFNDHPTLEQVTTVSITGGDFLTVSGDAFPIVNQSTDVIIAGSEPGLGRVIACGDINIFDHNHYDDEDNLQFGINLINWLSSARADVLFYIDNNDIENPYDAPAVNALNELGIPFYLTFKEYYMNLSLHSQQWSLVILDSAWPGIHPYLDDFSSYIDAGGELIISWHMLNVYQSEPFYSKVGIGFSADFPDEQPVHIWNPSHGIFNYPNNYGALNFTPGYDIGDEGDLMTVYSNATAIAGLTETSQPGNATIALGFGGQVLWNSYLIDQLTGDLDDSTYADNFELWMNEIAFMYYDRPTINHPDDVTYMETETGNEITWTPVADAGASEYVIRINGTSQGVTHWSGGAITINVDGVNASITNYQLTVFDRLGYSTSDLVILNVTEYVDPTTTGTGVPIDPMLLIIIGVGAIVVIVIIIIVMKKKK